jgi:hypothetical protein
MQIRNFGLTRITMDQIHDIIQDVEDLKYNDAQYQMNNELQNRDAQTKKGIYSDDFSNAAQGSLGDAPHICSLQNKICVIKRFYATKISYRCSRSSSSPHSTWN